MIRRSCDPQLLTISPHRAAAPLLHLVGFEPGPVEITVPRGRQRTSAPGIVHRGLLLPSDVTTIKAIPVTTPARTLIDLASVASRDAVEEALDDALRRGLVSMRRLRWRLDHAGRPTTRGVATMRALLDARDPSASIPQSVFESRLLRALREAGLPEPVTQHPVRRGGRLVAVLDFAYPDALLAIEADGYEWHHGRLRWEHDRARGNALMLLGWRVIHVTWNDLTNRRDAMIASIRAALNERHGATR